jgi:hypothetical protein
VSAIINKRRLVIAVDWKGGNTRVTTVGLCRNQLLLLLWSRGLHETHPISKKEWFLVGEITTGSQMRTHFLKKTPPGWGVASAKKLCPLERLKIPRDNHNWA